MAEIEIGTVVPCLVTNWGGVHEATAKRVAGLWNSGKPYWFVTVFMARGKGGKDLYPVHANFKNECDSFVLI